MAQQDIFRDKAATDDLQLNFPSISSDVLRTPLNIYDGASLQK